MQTLARVLRCTSELGRSFHVFFESALYAEYGDGSMDLFLFPVIVTGCVIGVTCAADTPLPPFVHGIVYRHYLVSHAPEAATAVRIHATDLTSDWITHTLRVTEQTDHSASIAVRDKRLWLAYHSVTPASVAPIVEEHLRHYSVNAFCGGEFISVNADGKSPREGLVVDWLWHELGTDQLSRLEKVSGLGAILQRDIVPIGEQAVLRFELVIPWPKPGQAPTGRMRVIRIESVHDVTKKQWKPVEATVLEDFDVGFTEPFQAVVVGKEYYFLTHSGNLFNVGPAELGKPRRCMPYWGPGQGRLSALIMDANKGSSFVFGQDDKGWFYAKLGPGLERQRFNGAVPKDRAYPYETAVELARVLISKEEITLPAPTRAPPSDKTKPGPR
jgi:hypothetical protein